MPMQVTLIVHSGPEAGRYVAVPLGSEVTVGRKAPARFVIAADPTLSRVHFALSRDGSTCRIRDLGSRAGTWLNGQPVDQADLKDGDVIEAGSTYLVVRFEPGADLIPSAVLAPATIPAPAFRDDPPTEEVGILDTESVPDRVLRILRSQPDPLFAILDAARDPLVLVRVQGCGEQCQSLYEGMKGERLAAMAPYLVSLPPGSPFLETLVREGWGKSWGVYLTCPEPFLEVRKHLRRFLTVKVEGGKELLFRYYDPRVLRIFLPTCDPPSLAQFFGPGLVYLAEDDDPAVLLRFEVRGDRLRRLALTETPRAAEEISSGVPRA